MTIPCLRDHPELLRHILTLLDGSDLATCLRVSTTFFHQTAPVLHHTINLDKKTLYGVFLGWDVPEIATPTQPSLIQRLLAKSKQGKGKISIHGLKLQEVSDLTIDEKPPIADHKPRNWKKPLLAHAKVIVLTTHSHTVCDTLVKAAPLLTSLETLHLVPSRIDSFRVHDSLCSHPSSVCPLAVARSSTPPLEAAVACSNHRFNDVVWVLPPDSRGLGSPFIRDMIISSPIIKIVFFPDEETRYDQTVRNEVQAPSIPTKRLIQMLGHLVARKGMDLTVIGLEAVAFSGWMQWMERIDWAQRARDIISKHAEEASSVVRFQTIEEYLRGDRADELGTGARKKLAERRGKWW